MRCGISMGRKKKQKKFDKTKAMKRLARDTFMDIPMETKVHKVKKKYNRKRKFKKDWEDDE